MRGGLPQRGDLDRRLEVRFAEAGNTLVLAGRVQHAHVEFERLADPVSVRGMIGEVVVGQRMDQCAEARRFDRRDYVGPGTLEEMDFVLRDWMRPDPLVGHVADEEDVRLALGRPVQEIVAQAFGARTFLGRVIDVGVAG
jgi:hypothetical protein